MTKVDLAKVRPAKIGLSAASVAIRINHKGTTKPQFEVLVRLQ
jgi:hypothetical protein